MKRPRKVKKKLASSTTLRPSAPRPRRTQGAVSQVRVDPVVRRRIEGLRTAPADLYWSCKASLFDFRTTREVAPLRGMLGQRQALRSLQMGLSVPSIGYNLFLCGLHGTESVATIERYIRSLRLPCVEVLDHCYVQNFQDPHRPRLLELPRGEGQKLQAETGRVLLRLNKTLAKAEERQWSATAKKIVGEFFPRLLRRFTEPEVQAWLRQWKKHLLEHVHHALIEDYEVNTLGSSRGRTAPVVVEKVPQSANLFGWIGRRPLGDQAPVPHFTEIRGGSFLAAEGGVLILNAADFYSLPGAWNTLKTCLKYGTLQIEDSDIAGAQRPGGMKPEPIPARLKVVMLGDFTLYDHLYDTDPDFRDVFKVRVDFDSELPLTSRVLRKQYPALISRTCKENDLRPVTAQGVARVLEYGVRRAGRKNKITLQSWFVADLLREADYWAESSRRRLITGADVRRAVHENIRRLNLVETKIAEMISEGTILITTSGRCVGQVNGLAIYDMGDYLFGKPSRITAETSYGHGGIINIERESGFSGRSHDKGVQILAGYLRSRFAQNRPLNLTASVCFEQSYSGIDGDSASATEIYAILSSLSGLPIRQDIAVTGSMNQKGDIQPIGGVNEKIEGFYDCIRAGRFTGKEGVIIPQKNVNDLMLREDVVQAVKRGEYHVYAINTVEEGLEILTEVAAGRRRARGGYTPGSAFAMVDRRLEEIAVGLRNYHTSEDD